MKLKGLIAGARKATAGRSVLPEAVGFVLLGMGLLLTLALVSHNPLDNAPLGVTPGVYQNKAGPLGARLAELLLGRIGLVSFLWTAFLLVYGFLMALGFVRWPKVRRFVGLFFLTFVLAALVHIHLVPADVVRLSLGPGGSIGTRIGTALLNSVGYGGSLIVLTLSGMAALVLTGNVAVSKTAHLLDDGIFHLRRLLQRPKRHRPDPPAAFPEAPTDSPRVPAAAQPAADKLSTARPAAAVALDFSSCGPKNARPDAGLFQVDARMARKGTDYLQLSGHLEERLREFKVEGRIGEVTEGPVVTTLEFDPAPGTKTSKIMGLGADLARLLSAQSLRILPSIPGKNTVGFEVPNQDRRTIRFGNVLKNFKTHARGMALPIVLGVDTFGATVIEDLAEMPHLLVAGSTGSGKSVFINTLIASLVYAHSARELRLVMIDPKMIELAAYDKLPHMACPVVKDLESDGRRILEGLVREMEDRYRRMGAVGARNVRAFNRTIRNKRRGEFPKYGGKWEAMPFLVIIIDEFADMSLVLGKDAETAITRLAQKARAAGIHLVIATQRPSVDVVTGLVKANFPTRIAFRVHSGVDSRTIIDQVGAETLLGKGDMLFQSAGGLQRLHAAYLEDSEVNEIVRACAA